MDKLTALKQYFGHDGFRPGQQALVDGLLAGRDVFGVMPTGGGKSVCYQLPALLFCKVAGGRDLALFLLSGSAHVTFQSSQ